MSDEVARPWPMTDPLQLLSWLDERAQAQFGREVNEWLGVIQYSSFMIRHAVDADSRWLYRQAAIKTAEMAYEIGVFQLNTYRERVTYARLSYARVADRSLVWRKGEVAEVADFVLEGIQISIESVRDKIRYVQASGGGWRSVDLNELKEMRAAKMLFRLFGDLRDYLTGDRRRQLDQWIEILPEMP